MGMTFLQLMTKRVKDNSGYTKFTWGKIEKGVVKATNDKDGRVIAEYNLNNGKLKIM